MPPKTKLKTKRKIRPRKQIKKPVDEAKKLQDKTFLLNELNSLKGLLMSRNIPTPGVSQFYPYINVAEQQINQIRAQANNTIQKAISETNFRLRDAGEQALSRISSMPLTEERAKEYEELDILAPSVVGEQMIQTEKRRGRPLGSKNKPKMPTVKEMEQEQEAEKFLSIIPGTTEFRYKSPQEMISKYPSEEFRGFIEL